MDVDRTRVLFVTCHLPYPPYSGGRKREYELLRRVGDAFDVTLCAVSKVYEEDAANAPALKTLCRDVFVFPSANPRPAEPRRGALPAQMERHRCPELTEHVARSVGSGAYDVVHVEGFYLMQHVPDPCPLPVLLVEQNVEYVLWRQRAETALRKQERDGAIAEYLRTLEAETAAWARADLCGALTPDDAAILSAAGGPGLQVRLIPDGVDHVALPRASAPGDPGHVVAFAANFAYQPNVDAALYLCREIWPRVARRLPHARLLLVGNAPPEEVRALGGRHDVVVTGRVPSVDPFLEKASVVVCPLRIGGGIKVKMLEAMGRGKAVVTTSVGAQGLGHVAGRAFVVEDQPAAFAHAVVSLLGDEDARRALEREARLAARMLPSWDDAAAALGRCYRELARRRSGPLTTAGPAT
ncbi:MAG TPA: glycosyltransferase family 4 protein [Actinomycetota bacterium]|nr:glycosyltransferase family 4 protein [Actinomycetota bacterium]